MVMLTGNHIRGSEYGVVMLSKAYTKHMGGKTLIVMCDNVQVLIATIPEGLTERFESRIERWDKD
jgi:hypothetical protein